MCFFVSVTREEMESWKAFSFVCCCLNLNLWRVETGCLAVVDVLTAEVDYSSLPPIE